MSEKPSLEQLISFLERLGQDKNYESEQEKIKGLLYIVANHVEMLGSLKKIKMKLASQATPAKKAEATQNS